MEVDSWDLGLGFGPLRRAREMGSDCQTAANPTPNIPVKSTSGRQVSNASPTVPAKSLEPLRVSSSQVPSRGPCPIRALFTVLQDLVQMKYGKVLDAADFISKVTSSTTNCGEIEPGQMIAALGARDDLQLRATNNELLDIKIHYRPVKRFDELRREVRRMPGTSCAVAVVAAEHGNSQVETTATFREGYVDSGILVGKSSPGPPLLRFTAREFRSATILDPVILRVLPQGGKSSAKTAPAASDEYNRIIRGRPPISHSMRPKIAAGISKSSTTRETDLTRDSNESHAKQSVTSELNTDSKLPSHPSPLARQPRSEVGVTVTESNPGTVSDHVIQSSPLRNETVEAMVSSMPSEEGMRRILELLDKPYALAYEALEALQILYTWLKPGQPNSHRARSMFATAGLHGQIVGAMRSLSAEANIVDQAFHVVLWASLGHAGNAEGLARSGAVAEICALMDLHRQNFDVQINGVQALDCLACYDSVAQLCVASGAPSRVLRAMNGNLSCAQLQFFGCKALQRLILRGGSPTAGIAAAAEAAKAAHPTDDGVRMYSVGLIKLVTPDAMWATSDFKTTAADSEQSMTTEYAIDRQTQQFN